MINVIVLGAGKWAHECWALLLPEFSGRYRIRAVVDPVPERATSMALALGLTGREAYDTLSAAIADHPEAGAAIVLTTPEQHADCILELACLGLDALTEKPLVTSPAQAARVTAAVLKQRIKLGVIQNYRYQNRIQTMRRLARDAQLGPLHYVVARFAADYRVPGSWDVGDAHVMADPLLVEGAIHHLDMIRYLTGQDINTVTAVAANPPGSSFAGDCLAGLLMRLAGGAFALYEGTLQAAGKQNRWREEYYRLEFGNGALVCTGSTVTLIRDSAPESIPTAHDADMFAGHRTLLRGFADWLEGGPPVETTLSDNLRSLAAVFAALQSVRSGDTVAVTALG